MKKGQVYKGVGPFWVKIEYIKFIKIIELNWNFRCHYKIKYENLYIIRTFQKKFKTCENMLKTCQILT